MINREGANRLISTWLAGQSARVNIKLEPPVRNLFGGEGRRYSMGSGLLRRSVRLRSNKAFRLHGETGEVDDLALDWCEFFAAAAANPVEFLSLCNLESANGVSLRPIAFSDSLRDTPESDKPPR